MSYTPDPFDTKHIRLPHELMALKEILAENVHDMWARQRVAEGWVFGPARDDQAKRHPCLVAYDQLPESEKDYDRETAVETLRAVLAHGYQIVPPTGTTESVPKSSEIERELGGLRDQLSAASPGNLSALIMRWRATPPDYRWNDLELSRSFIERLLEFNEPLLAFDFVSEGLAHWPDDIRLLQLKGLSLARSGAARKANQIFLRLRDQGHSDEETLANLARSHKSLWSEAQDPTAKQAHLDAAYDAYSTSYAMTNGYWSGINVAFLALMRGDRSLASETASLVFAQCSRQLDTSHAAGKDIYWLAATLGEASLIRGELNEAVEWYTRATAIAGRRFGNVASTCRQARQLVEQLGLDWSQFSSCFPLPEVVVFSSAIARQWQSLAEVPAPLRATIACAMRTQLASDGPMFGFSCLRSWLDLIFLETVLDVGGDVAVLLDDESADDESPGDDRQSANFVRLTKQLLARCSEIHYLTARTGNEAAVASEYAEKILVGLSIMQARQLGKKPVVLTMPQDEPGHLSSELRVLPLHIDRSEFESAIIGKPGVPEAFQQGVDSSAKILGTPPRVMALLFADVKGFSRLHEQQLITFSREFLGTVSQLVRTSEAKPVTRHTWGDGLFFTFERIVDAGMFALQLAGVIDSTDWQQLGLPADLAIRIGLHAGPVYECFDPVSEQTTFCGIHVNHAARIEPITPAGSVYASEAFAALASEENIGSFVCEYVGRTPLAKDFGLFSTYHVRHSTMRDHVTTNT